MLKEDSNCREHSAAAAHPYRVIHIGILSLCNRGQSKQMFCNRVGAFVRSGFVNVLGKLSCRLMAKDALPKDKPDGRLVPEARLYCPKA
jgi:hypothetical protein